MGRLELKKEFTKHRPLNRFLEFSQDGNTLASTGYRSDTVALWDVATGEELLTLEGVNGRTVFARFSADGKALATLSEPAPKQQLEVRLWLAPGEKAEPAQSQAGGSAK